MPSHSRLQVTSALPSSSVFQHQHGTGVSLQLTFTRMHASEKGWVLPAFLAHFGHYKEIPTFRQNTISMYVPPPPFSYHSSKSVGSPTPSSWLAFHSLWVEIGVSQGHLWWRELPLSISLCFLDSFVAVTLAWRVLPAVERLSPFINPWKHHCE